MSNQTIFPFFYGSDMGGTETVLDDVNNFLIAASATLNNKVNRGNPSVLNLNLNDQPAINAAEGSAPTDAVTFGQLKRAIAAKQVTTKSSPPVYQPFSNVFITFTPITKTNLTTTLRNNILKFVGLIPDYMNITDQQEMTRGLVCNNTRLVGVGMPISDDSLVPAGLAWEMINAAT